MPTRTSLSKTLIVLLAATSALGPAAMQILLPALPVIKETFEVSTEVAQLTLSLSMLAIALGTLFYGPLSDKYGRKPVMLLGLFITVVGSVFCFLANTIELLIIGRFIQAFGGAVGLVLARAIVRDVYGAQEAARVIATLVMVMVVIPMLSPALGGEIMHRIGWEYVFVVIALACILILLLLSKSLPETLKEPVPFTGTVAMLKNYGLLFQVASVLRLCLLRYLCLGSLLQFYFRGTGDHGVGSRSSAHGVWLLFCHDSAGLHDGQLFRPTLRTPRRTEPNDYPGCQHRR